MASRTVRLPAAEDPLVRSAAEVIGGPVGRYARVPTEPWEPTENSGVGRMRRAGVVARARTRIPVLPWAPVASLLSVLAAVTMVVGITQKGYCYTRGWAVPEAFWRACYVDMPYLFANTQLVAGRPPYPSEGTGGLSQPLGTGVLLWVTSLVVPGEGAELARQQWYVGIWTVLLTAALIALVVLTAATARRDPWRAAQVALSPLVVTVAVVSPDLIGVCLLAGALYLWARDRPVAAGVVFGLATLTRTYPILVAVMLLPLAIRSGRLRPAVRSLAACLATVVGLLAVTVMPSGLAVLRPYGTWLSAGADYGSWGYLARVVDRDVPVSVMTAVAILGWVMALAAGAALALMPRHRPAVAEVALVVVALVVLTGKSIPVQTSLWLVPLVALAGLRWRDHLIWAATEVAYFVAVWLHLGGTYDANRAFPLPWYGLFVVLRMAGILWLVVVVVRRVRARPAARPSIGPEQAVQDDPDDAAGPLTGARDAVVVAIQ